MRFNRIPLLNSGFSAWVQMRDVTHALLKRHSFSAWRAMWSFSTEVEAKVRKSSRAAVEAIAERESSTRLLASETDEVKRLREELQHAATYTEDVLAQESTVAVTAAALR